MLKDSITQTFNEDGHEFVLTHYFNTQSCYEIVKESSQDYWNKKNKRHAEENYLFEDETPWSLGKMLLNNNFELGFSVLMKDGVFFAAAGLRKHSPDSTIVLSRFFGKHALKPYANAFILPLHLKISKEEGFKESIITFNKYNEHLVNYYLDVLPKKTDSVSKAVWDSIRHFKALGLQEVNFVDQYVLACDLQQISM